MNSLLPASCFQTLSEPQGKGAIAHSCLRQNPLAHPQKQGPRGRGESPQTKRAKGNQTEHGASRKTVEEAESKRKIPALRNLACERSSFLLQRVVSICLEFQARNKKQKRNTSTYVYPAPRLGHHIQGLHSIFPREGSDNISPVNRHMGHKPLV